MDTNPPSDMLNGAEEIAEFLYGNRKFRRRIYHLADTRQLPVFRVGGRLTARKSALARHFEELERAVLGEVA